MPCKLKYTCEHWRMMNDCTGCGNNEVEEKTVFINTINKDMKKYILDSIKQSEEMAKTIKDGARKLLHPSIKDVIFNYPATIVFWTDGTKTVVKAHGEKYDPEKGLAMAIAKKYLGNQGNYYNVFKKHLDKLGLDE